MIMRIVLLAVFMLVTQLALANDSYKHNYKIEVIHCDDVTGFHGDFLQNGDVIETWRWWIFRGAKIQRSGNPDWKLKIKNSDRKDIFATVRLPAHGGGTGTEEHCVAIEYAGYDTVNGRHFVDLFVLGMPAGQTCDAAFLDETKKESLRPPTVSCGVVSHNGSARGFFP